MYVPSAFKNPINVYFLSVELFFYVFWLHFQFILVCALQKVSIEMINWIRCFLCCLRKKSLNVENLFDISFFNIRFRSLFCSFMWRKKVVFWKRILSFKFYYSYFRKLIKRETKAYWNKKINFYKYMHLLKYSSRCSTSTCSKLQI